MLFSFTPVGFFLSIKKLFCIDFNFSWEQIIFVVQWDISVFVGLSVPSFPKS